MSTLAITDRTRITRLRDRQVPDRRALHDVLDSALVAHVGVVRDGTAVVLPMGCARDGDGLLLHGSSGGGLLRAAATGAEITATVTVLDGLVYARTVFDSSMNYRSAMVVGVAQVLEDDAKVAGLRVLSEHLMPGRWDEVRPPTPRELAATLVLRLPLDEASVKVRSGAPSDDAEEPRDVWAGVVPLAVAVGAPLTGPDVPAAVEVPASVRALHRTLPGS
ncbi:hypothetical protein CLV92_11221 [Kineococcus xinjiangensis]|uniref:Nitroimidazol reductase NimA-like FMN-containing flavoprotein (Pyridoxamine 5'-phosphate oxidase superfamily) n=1 Tax=Kineococcus xinjiangensis TaxID=512762 RepID=A0A2S6IF64_9ACTN|nr:pyridoxamine 5'-phosphate oxidase family protein [Kineococcus xinjiangensis]PPK92849.1 hypothetical protein CLV92_11221 [Kineococcus xinjiangensis]